MVRNSKTGNPESFSKKLFRTRIQEKDKVNPNTTPGVGNDTPAAGANTNKPKDFM